MKNKTPGLVVTAAGLLTLALHGGATIAQDRDPDPPVERDPPKPEPQRAGTPASAQGSGGERDPFQTRQAMVEEAVQRGRQSGPRRAAIVPLIRLRAFLELDGKPPAALLEIEGAGFRRVQQGDSLNLQVAARRNRRRTPARRGAPARTAPDQEPLFGDATPSSSSPPPAARRQGSSTAVSTAVITLRVVEIANGAVVVDVPALGQRLTVN